MPGALWGTASLLLHSSAAAHVLGALARVWPNADRTIEGFDASLNLAHYHGRLNLVLSSSVIVGVSEAGAAMSTQAGNDTRSRSARKWRGQLFTGGGQRNEGAHDYDDPI